MIVKLLGAIDLTASIIFLMLVFGISPFFQLTLFCAGILLIKGLFVLTGDVLSIVDLISSILLIFSLFLTLPAAILWLPAFLLLSKGFVSFL